MARKSRKQIAVEEPVIEPVSSEVFSTAIYARLSVENSGKSEKVDVIANQIEICKSYIAERPYLNLIDTYCADCSKPMVLHRAHTMKPEQNHFTCRTYKKDGAEVCSAHYIREVALKEIVLETIRRATEFARSDPERFAAYIQQKQSTEVAKEIRGLERELSTMRKRDGELDVVFKRMYEDSALGRVSNEQFRLLSEAYSKEKAQLAEAIPATEERLEKLRSSMANAKNFIAKARKFTDMTELTPELLRTFVAKIIVYEKEVKYSKHAPQKIHICFRDFNLNETDDMLLCGETTEKADSTIALPA